MAIEMHYANVFASAGFTGESFNIAAGPANTGVISALLSVGNGSLTEDAPHALVSTGALGAARSLILTGMETELDSGVELNGRFFYLSIQNSDITTNSITVSGGSTINGSATFEISNPGDYIFHHIAGGVWRCNILATPGNNIATFKRLSFVAADWTNGTANQIIVSQASGPGAGQIGPHGITPYDGYVLSVLNKSLTPHEYVDVEIHQDVSNGDVTLIKAALAPAFDGEILMVGSLD